MRKVLFLFLLLPFISSSQLYSPATLFGKHENRLNVWYNLSIPNDTIHPLISLQHLPHIAATPASGKFWIWSTTLFKWVEISGGGGSSDNIYTANGTLTSNRTLTAANYNLTIIGTTNYLAQSRHVNQGFGPDFWTEFKSDALSASMTSWHGTSFATINVNTANGGDPIVNIQATGGPGASRLTWYPDSLLFSFSTGKANFPFLRSAFDTNSMQGIKPLGITPWGGIVKLSSWPSTGTGGGGGSPGGDILFGNTHIPFYDTLAYFPAWDTSRIKMKAVDIRADLSGRIAVDRPISGNTDSTLTWVIDVVESSLQLGLMGGAVTTGQGGVPTGGTTGQVLAKLSNTNRDVGWVDGGGGGISGLTTGRIVYATSSTTIGTRANIVPTATGLDLTDSRIMLKKTGTGASEVYLTADNFGLEIRNDFFGNDGFRLLPAGSNLQFQSTGVGDFLFMPAQVEKMRLYSDGNFRLVRLASGGTSPTMDGTAKMVIVDTDGDLGFQTIPSGGGAPAWGAITGTLSSQTDLQSALNLKAPLASPSFTGTINFDLGVWGFQRMLYIDASNNLAAATFQPNEVVLNTGSFSNPSWITSLAYTKLSGVSGNNQYIGTNGGGTFGAYTLTISNWDAGYNDKINSAAFSGTNTKTLTLTQQDGGTVTASFTDLVNTYTGSDFILNQNASGQTGNFWLTGNGELNNLTIDGTSITWSGISAPAGTRLLSVTSGKAFAVTTIDPANIVLTTGSYADPSWITSLAYTKISGVSGNSKYIGTNSGGTFGFYDLPSGGGGTITLSGEVTGSGTTAITTSIATNTVDFNQIQQISTARFLGRTTAATGDIEQLTATQATAMLNTFTTTLNGLVPAPGTSNTTDFLRRDGSWAAPATGGTGTVTNFSAGDLSPLFTTSEATTTTTPALTFTLNTQVANTIFSGPSTGADAAPTFRALVSNDIPSLATSKITWTGSTAQYLRGDGSLATFPTTVSTFTNDAAYITNSNAYYDLNQAGGVPSSPASGFSRLFSNADDYIAMKDDNGFAFSLGPTSTFTASRTFTFPDLGGVVATTNATQTLTSKTISFSAGTTSVAPITLTSGTNLTTAVAGSFEYDGKALYFTSSSTERGSVDVVQIACLNTAYTLSNTTGVQPVFAAAAGADAVGLSASTTYQFEAFYSITTATTTTRTISVAFGGTATITNIMFEAEYNGGATNGTLGSWNESLWTAAAGGVINATNTNASNRIKVRGTIRVNAAGTLIPQINFSAAPGTTNTTNVNSYFRIWPIGAGTINTLGNWQ